MTQPHPAVSRRAVLGGAAVLPLALSACGEEVTADPAPHPDVAVLTGAIAAEADLVALYEAARGTHPALAERLDPILAHHREHLTVLRRHLLPGTGGSQSPAPSAPAPPSVPGTPRKAIAALRKAESRAAAARVTDVSRVRPALAQLLAGIGTSEAAHAAVLARPS